MKISVMSVTNFLRLEEKSFILRRAGASTCSTLVQDKSDK